VPDLEGELRCPLGVTAGEELDEPFVPFDRCLPILCEAVAFRSTHDGAELVEYRLDGTVPEDGHRDRVQLVIGVERGGGVAGAHGPGEAVVPFAHSRHLGIGQIARHLSCNQQAIDLLPNLPTCNILHIAGVPSHDRNPPAERPPRKEET
jgi:hypothetical protein